MVSRHAVAALAALSTLAAASPVKRSGFSVTQVDTGRKVLRNGPKAYAQALAKYGQPVPASVVEAFPAEQSGSVGASPSDQYDSEYLAPVSVGGQTLNLDFDTGSSDLWVFSNELPSSKSSGHQLYDTSSGSLESGESWSITYGDQSGASGNVYADTVVIGGVTATQQAVEAATSVSSSFTQNTADSGLVGFAFSSINTVQPTQQQTWFDNVKSSLPSEIFAVTLKYHAEGTYDFGYIDDSKYSGSIVYTPVDNSQGFWSFSADDYSIGGSAAGSGGLTGIADTGTTLILVSDDILSAYYGQVSGASNSGGWTFPCSASLPDFALVIGGQTFTVPGEYINYAPNGGNTCYGGLQSSSGIGFSIFGDVFLKAQYVVFDSGNTQLGFASQA